MKKNIVAERAVCYILSRKVSDLRKLKAHDVASVIDCSLDFLEDAFLSEQNMSVKDFLDREIMNRAVFILERDKMISIRGISERLGFTNVMDFEDAFFNFMLVKPSRYRELIKLRRNFSGYDLRELKNNPVYM